jgi:succinate-acetate transporter protein
MLAGVFSYICNLPLLFPSLGVTTLTQAHRNQRSSLPLWRKLLGGLFPVLAGYVAVYSTQANFSATFGQIGYVSFPHIWASVISICLVSTFQILTKIFEPAAGATVLIISLGLFKTSLSEIASLVIGISFMIIASEFLVRIGEKTIRKFK